MPRKFMRRSFRRRRRYRPRARNFRRRIRRIAFSIAEKKYADFALVPGDPVRHTASFDTNIVGISAYAVPANVRPMSVLNRIANGVETGQRIGNNIFVEYIQLTIYIAIKPNPTEVMMTNGCLCRYGLYWDRASGGAATPGIGLFSNDFGGSENGTTKLRDVYTLGKYKTLLDKQFRMAYFTSNNTSGTSVIQHYIPIKRQINYRGPAALSAEQVANMIKNDVFFTICASSAAMCYASIGVRVCYRDA